MTSPIAQLPLSFSSMKTQSTPQIPDTSLSSGLLRNNPFTNTPHTLLAGSSITSSFDRPHDNGADNGVTATPDILPAQPEVRSEHIPGTTATSDTALPETNFIEIITNRKALESHQKLTLDPSLGYPGQRADAHDPSWTATSQPGIVTFDSWFHGIQAQANIAVSNDGRQILDIENSTKSYLNPVTGITTHFDNGPQPDNGGLRIETSDPLISWQALPLSQPEINLYEPDPGSFNNELEKQSFIKLGKEFAPAPLLGPGSASFAE